MQIGSFKDAAVSGGFWMSWLLLVLAALIPAPAAGFMLAFLTVTCAVFPLAFGDTRRRVGGAIALILGVVLALSLAGKVKQDPYFKKQRSQPAPVSGQPAGSR